MSCQKHTYCTIFYFFHSLTTHTHTHTHARMRAHSHTVISELKELGLLKWQGAWDSSNKGALTKTFFPKVKDRLAKRLQMCLNLSTVITGQGKLRAYLHRFKIIEDLMCRCEMNPQTTDHLTRECTLLSKQRQSLKNSIMKAGGSWPISNTELAKHIHDHIQKVWELHKSRNII